MEEAGQQVRVNRNDRCINEIKIAVILPELFHSWVLFLLLLYYNVLISPHPSVSLGTDSLK